MAIVSRLRSFLATGDVPKAIPQSGGEMERARAWQALLPQFEQAIAVRGLSHESIAGTWQIAPERLAQLLAGQAIPIDDQLHRAEIWLDRHPPLDA